MPPVKNSTKEEQVAVLNAIRKVREQEKKRPTISDIVRCSALTSRATRVAVSKMVREDLLFTEWTDNIEYIYPTTR